MVKFFPAMHDPKGKRYTLYYSIVLIGATIVAMCMTLQLIHQNILQGGLTFFEGFFSLFMLCRNETVGKALLSHMSFIASLIRR